MIFIDGFGILHSSYSWKSVGFRLILLAEKLGHFRTLPTNPRDSKHTEKTFYLQDATISTYLFNQEYILSLLAAKLGYFRTLSTNLRNG